MDPKAYLIGGRKFWQLPLGVGQIEYLLPKLTAIDTLQGLDHAGLVEMLSKVSGGIPGLLAIVLIPDGETRADVLERLDRPGGTEELERFFRANVEFLTVMEIVNDFFAFNPLSPMLTFLNRVLSIRQGDASSAAA